MNIQDLHTLFLQHPTVSTDSRKIEKNAIFFALKGDTFNGNTYAHKAIKQGASFAVIDEQKYHIDDQTILVEDTLETLQKLANYHRNYCNATIIGLTGSNGKTTTKELIYAVLSKKYNTIATNGNLNNHIGVPLTLLRIKKDTELAVVEMGANHQMEIAFLSAIAEPDFGYITNFGKAHLEGFGGVDGVIKGKSEMYDYLMKNDKSIFYNADDPIQLEKLNAYIKKYGFSSIDPKCYPIHLVSANPFVTIKVEHMEIKTQLIGAYNFHNCCAAIIMGKYFNVGLNDIKIGIEQYHPENNRSQIITKDGYYIILDAYNANPSSMKVALESFYSLNTDKNEKLVILGDMFELGDAAEEEHQTIADLALSLSFDSVLLVGEHFFKTDTQFIKLKSFDKLKGYFNENKINPSTAILIKGSRGMALERILDLL